MSIVIAQLSTITSLGLAGFAGNEGVVKLLLKHENLDPSRPDELTAFLFYAYLDGVATCITIDVGITMSARFAKYSALRALGMPRFSGPLAMLKEEKSPRIQPLIRE